MKFKIELWSEHSETYEVEADSKEEALEIVETGDENSKLISEDYANTEVIGCTEIK